MLINDTSRPLIFVGTNSNMYQYSEMCESVGISVAGIIDSDYFGNTDTYCDIPVIDSQESFNCPEKLDFYKKNYNFFCAVNWTPITSSPIAIRNREKRRIIIDLIDQCNLRCVSLVSSKSCVSPSATVGKGVFIDHLVNIESKVVIGDFTNLYAYTHVGHTSVIGRNCVFQRISVLAHDSVFEDEVYFSPLVKLTKGGVRIGTNTFIHEGVYIRRGTIPNEIVSLTGGNLSRVIKL